MEGFSLTVVDFLTVKYTQRPKQTDLKEKIGMVGLIGKYRMVVTDKFFGFIGFMGFGFVFWFWLLVVFLSSNSCYIYIYIYSCLETSVAPV